jgi:ABC-type oligopeptide transport system ATPase subunit
VSVWLYEPTSGVIIFSQKAPSHAEREKDKEREKEINKAVII